MSERFFLKAFALLMLLIPGLGLAQPLKAAEAQSLLSAYVSYTDLRMRSVQQSLEILASTAEAGSADWEKMKPLLNGYQKSDGGLVVWFSRPDGTFSPPTRGAWMRN